MKKILFFALAILSVILSTSCHHNPHKPKTVQQFKGLLYNAAEMNEWLSTKSKEGNIQQIVFCFYDSGSDSPWTLVGYGQTQSAPGSISDGHDTLKYVTMDISSPFASVYQDSIIKVVINPFTIGNLNIPTDTMNTILSDAKVGANNYLFFVPDVNKNNSIYGNFNLGFRLYMVQCNDKRRIISISPLTNTRKKFQNIVVKDDNQNDYIGINPCPPANMILPQ